MTLRQTALAAAVLSIAVPASANHVHDDEEYTPLEANEVFEGEFDLESAGSMCFLLDLPIDVVALDILLTCPLADLDLYANPGGHPDDEEYGSLHQSVGDDGEERITARRLGYPELEGGALSVCVDWAYESPPIVGGRPLASAPFRLEARVFEPRVDAVLEIGRPHTDTLRADTGFFRMYEVEVPEGAEALRIDLFDAAGDIDVFARHRRKVLMRGPLVAAEENPWGAETLLLLPPGDNGQPALRPGTWYVQVINQVDPTEADSFSIVASLGTDVPEAVRGIPPTAPPADARGVRRSLAGVFEIFCGPLAGSGTVVTAGGLVLTNAHVVDTGREDPVILCAPLVRGLPPREAFRGRVVELDRERDLALVQIESGFWGDPIPPDYAYPVVPLGDPDAMAMGDPLLLAGYPTIGGQKSRVSVSLSRGIVSGFERGPHGLFIKTDAEIEGGSSGGAALDDDGRLVGVPSSKVEVGSGHFGFVQPLTALPAPWRARLGL